MFFLFQYLIKSIYIITYVKLFSNYKEYSTLKEYDILCSMLELGGITGILKYDYSNFHRIRMCTLRQNNVCATLGSQ